MSSSSRAPDAAPTAAGDVSRRIRGRLRESTDPSRAAGQQAYMKSAMPFLGVRLPDVRRTALTVVREAGIDDPSLLREIAEGLWDGAGYREERYAAMAVLGARPLRGRPEVVPVIERMVREGQWWDITDELAHRMSEQHEANPAMTRDLVLRWSVDEDPWLRRLAILSQLGRRGRVDAELLAAVIEPTRAEQGFFLRKAIGWALREYARVDPGWVRQYVASHALSPLSVREATKHL